MRRCTRIFPPARFSQLGFALYRISLELFNYRLSLSLLINGRRGPDKRGNAGESRVVPRTGSVNIAQPGEKRGQSLANRARVESIDAREVKRRTGDSLRTADLAARLRPIGVKASANFY